MATEHYSQRQLDWMQHEFSFGVWSEAKSNGLLRIIPTGCELGPEMGLRRRAYGVYVQLKLEKDGFLCSSIDFIGPQCFRDLLAMLKHKKEETHLAGDDGGIGAHFQWREDGLVSVVGSIPANANWREYFLTSDPLAFKKWIMTSVEFEFWITPEAALETGDEIERLLEYLASVEESNSK